MNDNQEISKMLKLQRLNTQQLCAAMEKVGGNSELFFGRFDSTTTVSHLMEALARNGIEIHCIVQERGHES